MKTIKEWAEDIATNAAAHGWDDGVFLPLSPEAKLAKHMLFVSEISEATESVRKNEDAIWFDETGKPEGEAVELIDAVIRIFHYFELRGWDAEQVMKLKHDYNLSRPFRHGGKSI